MENPSDSSQDRAVPVQDDSLDMRKLLPVIFIVLVDVLSLTIIIPIIPYYAISFGATPVGIGILAATFPLMQFVFVPILGSLSDRVGRKPVLASAQVGTFLSLLVLGFANSFWILVLARALDGVTGANIATAQAVITDSTSPQNRAKGLGLIGATFGIGFVLGPALSGIALSLSGNNYAVPAFVAAGFAFVSILLTTFVLPETLPPEKRGQSARKTSLQTFGGLLNALGDERIGIILIFAFVYQLVFGAFQITFAPLTLNLLGLNSLGNAIFFTVFGILIAVVQGGLVGPLSNRYGERMLLFVGLILSIFSFFLGGFTQQQPVPWYSRDALVEELSQQAEGATLTEADLEARTALLPPEGESGYFSMVYLLLAILPLTVGISLVQPSTNSLLTRRSDPDKAGEVLGYSGAALALGSFLGPLYGGWLFQAISPNGLYFVNAALLSMFLVVALRYLKPLPEDVLELASAGDVA